MASVAPASPQPTDLAALPALLSYAEQLGLDRHLAIGFQMEQVQGRPEHIREPLAFRAQHVDGLGTFEHSGRVLVLYRTTTNEGRVYALSWTGCAIRAVA